MKVLVTGAAGFIGSNVTRALIQRGDTVIGIDNFECNSIDYYAIKYRKDRITALNLNIHNLDIRCLDINDKVNLGKLFAEEKFDSVIHLAAQTGVRYSVEHPYPCFNNNVTGFLNILDACRNYNVNKIVFASSSSVYGNLKQFLFHEDDDTDKPVSFYAATKKADEIMAYSYSALYNIQCIALRYFTVYGPWGRLDMMPMIVAEALYRNNPIKLFNQGNMWRDFTYIDDVVDGTLKALNYNVDYKIPFKVFNIGNGHSIKLIDFVDLMEKSFGKKAQKILLPMQQGDVEKTCADIILAQRILNYEPQWPIEKGIEKFTKWYNNYIKN